MSPVKTLVAIGAMLALAACGEAVQQAKQGAAEIGGQALEAARGAVDTRTACMIAGQSEAFCGCVQERLGAEIKAEHVDALTSVVRDTVSGQGVEAAAQGAENIDTSTREALVQCATHAAIQGAVSEGAN
jgi:hypothetical protein